MFYLKDIDLEYVSLNVREFLLEREGFESFLVMSSFKRLSFINLFFIDICRVILDLVF